MATTALLLDYLFLRDLMVARLAESLIDPLVQVDGIETFAQATERNVVSPSLFVLWEGDAFSAGQAGRLPGLPANIVTQTWAALLAVRNAAQHQADARDASAGPLLSKVHRAVNGWTPEGATRPFVRTSGRRATYGANVALYPLTFAIDLYL